MHLKKRLLRLHWLRRLLATFSVRTRIIVLALVPVVGFLANGMTYVSGEDDVGRAFQTVAQARALADASRDFKIAIASMRIAVKDFARNSGSHSLLDTFTQSRQLAAKSLDSIQASIGGKHSDDVVALRQDLADIKNNYDKLYAVQRVLGFSEQEGLRQELKDAGNKIERAINNNMTWLAETEARKLMMLLLTMRHQEAEYRLNPRDLTEQQFNAAYTQFIESFSKIDGTPQMKGKLQNDVKHYVDTFAKWITLSDRAHPLRALIDIDSQNMMPRADAIIMSANDAAKRAAEALIGIAAPHPRRHHRSRHRHGRARPRLQLADRP